MLKERGLTDMALVVCDPWSVHMAPTDLAAGKLIQLFMYFRTEPNDNHYAHPLDFTPIVDLYQKKVSFRSCGECTTCPATDSMSFTDLSAACNRQRRVVELPNWSRWPRDCLRTSVRLGHASHRTFLMLRQHSEQPNAV